MKEKSYEIKLLPKKLLTCIGWSSSVTIVSFNIEAKSHTFEIIVKETKQASL
jgi:hypothetical protein